MLLSFYAFLYHTHVHVRSYRSIYSTFLMNALFDCFVSVALVFVLTPAVFVFPVSPSQPIPQAHLSAKCWIYLSSCQASLSVVHLSPRFGHSRPMRCRPPLFELLASPPKNCNLYSCLPSVVGIAVLCSCARYLFQRGSGWNIQFLTG